MDGSLLFKREWVGLGLCPSTSRITSPFLPHFFPIFNQSLTFFYTHTHTHQTHTHTACVCWPGAVRVGEDTRTTQQKVGTKHRTQKSERNSGSIKQGPLFNCPFPRPIFSPTGGGRETLKRFDVCGGQWTMTFIGRV